MAPPNGECKMYRLKVVLSKSLIGRLGASWIGEASFRSQNALLPNNPRPAAIGRVRLDNPVSPACRT